AVADLDVAALVVERRPADRRSDVVRFAARMDRHAAVAFLRVRVAIETVVPVGAKGRIAELAFLRFGFLQANDIGLLLAQPVEEPFACSRADAVGVERDNAHWSRDSRWETRDSG